MIIDFHTHIFPPRLKSARHKYIGQDPLFGLLYANPKAKLATVDELISGMDNRSIDVSVILNINWQNPELRRETNDYILESVSRFPKRLVGFGILDMDSPDNACQELDYCLRGGIKGIGEIRPSRKFLKNMLSFKPLIQKMIDCNLILLTHVSEPLGHIYSGKGDITPEALYPIITAFPELKLVCAHWGGGLPFYALMPEVKKVLNNVYFDSAASPFLYNPQVYKQAALLVGEDKILFGSDYPLLDPARLLKEIEELNFSDALKNKILCKNALRLLGNDYLR
jgi:predicted TIM-barrel fold metal-dependent hydrolase